MLKSSILREHRCELPTGERLALWGFKPGTLFKSVRIKKMSFTWSVKQSGHPTAVADVLFTTLCTGGDGCHLQTHTQTLIIIAVIIIFIISFISLSQIHIKTKLASRTINQVSF